MNGDRAKRGKRKTYRQAVLELDPKATLRGPIYVGQYGPLYSVYDGAGVEIGWTGGNETGASWAWSRAYTTLVRRAQAIREGRLL